MQWSIYVMVAAQMFFFAHQTNYWIETEAEKVILYNKKLRIQLLLVNFIINNSYSSCFVNVFRRFKLHKVWSFHLWIHFMFFCSSTYWVLWTLMNIELYAYWLLVEIKIHKQQRYQKETKCVQIDNDQRIIFNKERSFFMSVRSGVASNLYMSAWTCGRHSPYPISLVKCRDHGRRVFRH